MLNSYIRSINLIQCGFHRNFFSNTHFKPQYILLRNYSKTLFPHLVIYNRCTKMGYKFHKEHYWKSLLRSYQFTNAFSNCDTRSEKETVGIEGGSISVHEATRLCTEKFEADDIPEADLHAAYIVAHVIGIDRVRIYLCA